MILELLEVDRPKTIGEKLAEYLSRPPQPILKFYGDFSSEVTDGERHLLFAVRNGLPLPLLYGIYVEARYDGLADYAEKTDHIGPFSTDDWRLTLDISSPAQIELRVGLVPLEFILDRVQIAV
ncbi:unnamed protein product [marine sediment metagenome]|uniref:Uncharacterized protein n=2 Tax=marine sediment metagenome TaxID=412755 RepID=X1Q5Y3_9ZZZZ